MKKNIFTLVFYSFLLFITIESAFPKSSFRFNGNDDHYATVIFPNNFTVGDYVEFVQVEPISAGSSGYYEISISYTRGNIAAAATHLASISHAGSNIWREVGRINNNTYAGTDQFNFTIDCNTNGASPKFRIRAVNTYGINTNIPVYIKIKSVNYNNSWTPLNVTGNDITVNKYLAMTNDWDLYVGNVHSVDGANLAIKAIHNGNVGIGVTNPTEKLSVNGKIRAKEIKVEAINWPDYVFGEDYELPELKNTEEFIKKNKHLPGIPSAEEVEKEGVSLGEMNNKLLKKIEELTLHLISMKKELDELKTKIK
jgi:hypothetical protein